MIQEMGLSKGLEGNNHRLGAVSPIKTAFKNERKVDIFRHIELTEFMPSRPSRKEVLQEKLIRYKKVNARHTDEVT